MYFNILLDFNRSVTIQNIQEHAHELWRYQRFLIVNEYAKLTPLPAPFNIFYYMIRAVQICILKIKTHRKQKRIRMIIIRLHSQRVQEVQSTLFTGRDGLLLNHRGRTWTDSGFGWKGNQLILMIWIMLSLSMQSSHCCYASRTCYC